MRLVLAIVLAVTTAEAGKRAINRHVTVFKKGEGNNEQLMDETVFTNPQSFDYDFSEDLAHKADTEDVYDQMVAKLPAFDRLRGGVAIATTEIPLVTRKVETWFTPAMPEVDFHEDDRVGMDPITTPMPIEVKIEEMEAPDPEPVQLMPGKNTDEAMPPMPPSDEEYKDYESSDVVTIAPFNPEWESATEVVPLPPDVKILPNAGLDELDAEIRERERAQQRSRIIPSAVRNEIPVADLSGAAETTTVAPQNLTVLELSFSEADNETTIETENATIIPNVVVETTTAETNKTSSTEESEPETTTVEIEITTTTTEEPITTTEESTTTEITTTEIPTTEATTTEAETTTTIQTTTASATTRKPWWGRTRPVHRVPWWRTTTTVAPVTEQAADIQAWWQRTSTTTEEPTTTTTTLAPEPTTGRFLEAGPAFRAETHFFRGRHQRPQTQPQQRRPAFRQPQPVANLWWLENDRTTAKPRRTRPTTTTTPEPITTTTTEEPVVVRTTTEQPTPVNNNVAEEIHEMPRNPFPTVQGYRAGSNNNNVSRPQTPSVPVSRRPIQSPAYRAPTFKCRLLNPFNDSHQSPQHDQRCRMLYPGMSLDGTCRCFYKVSSRDAQGCPEGFIYACKPNSFRQRVVF